MARRAESGRLVAARQRAVRQVEESERGEDGDRLAELEVIGLSPAPERGIVHGRQVVEDERRGVDELHRGSRGERVRRLPPQSSAESSVSTGRTRFDGANSV